jgi:hypothetical protein
MSCRVSVPTTARLIGLAQPPRPRPLRAGPRGLVVGVATGFILPPSSHALVTRVRNLSASILSPTCAGARLCRRLSPTTVRLRPRLALLSPPNHFACGSLRRLPIDAHAAALGVAAARTGRVYLLRLVSCRSICRPYFMPDRPWAPPFRGFSPPSPRCPLGLRCPPCRSPPCGAAAPRISATGRTRSPTPTLFTPTKGRSSPGRSPLRGRPSGLAPHFCRAPLMGFNHAPEPTSPLAVRRQPHAHVRSSECQRTGSPARVTEPPSVGSVPPHPSSFEAGPSDRQVAEAGTPRREAR